MCRAGPWRQRSLNNSAGRAKLTRAERKAAAFVRGAPPRRSASAAARSQGGQLSTRPGSPGLGAAWVWRAPRWGRLAELLSPFHCHCHSARCSAIPFLCRALRTHAAPSHSKRRGRAGPALRAGSRFPSPLAAHQLCDPSPCFAVRPERCLPQDDQGGKVRACLLCRLAERCSLNTPSSAAAGRGPPLGGKVSTAPFTPRGLLS